MKKIILKPNKEKTGFAVASEYSKNMLKVWLTKYKAFDLTPRNEDSSNKRRYLEGAVIPAYCKWQYQVDERDYTQEQLRDLFKQDFHFDIVTDRNGNPKKLIKSSKGELTHILNTFTRYAEENGCPIPNPELYKDWRDKWSMDMRFPHFQDFLDYLGIECDSMPSLETLKRLNEK